MARRNQMLELLGAQSPVGASAGPVGTDAIGTAELEGAAPREGGEAPGEEATKNAIMQAMASPAQGAPGAGAPGGEMQLTPEEEEMLRAQLALAARQRLLGGRGV